MNKFFVSDFKNLVFDILFPKYCLGCGKEEAYICKSCELFMNEINNTENLISLWEYNGIVERAIKEAKYKGRYDILRELVSKKEFKIKENTIITYVPMHIKKEKRRGFNQAEIIAKEIGKRAGVPVVKLLEKIKETPEQVKLNREQRLNNLKDSFAEARPLQKEKYIEAIRGRASILIVDDVYTTGATMEECGTVLHKAGFKNIQGFTIARTI